MRPKSGLTETNQGLSLPVQSERGIHVPKWNAQSHGHWTRLSVCANKIEQEFDMKPIKIL